MLLAVLMNTLPPERLSINWSVTDYYISWVSEKQMQDRYFYAASLKVYENCTFREVSTVHHFVVKFLPCSKQDKWNFNFDESNNAQVRWQITLK